MFERLFKVIQGAFNDLLGKVEDPAIMIVEQSYQDLQTQANQFRQAVAQAIATEKQLEQTLSKNKDQAPADLEVQLKQQKEATSKLRQRLTELKNEMQKVQTEKQMLIARDKAAKATMKANEILSKTSSTDTLKVIEELERRIQGLSRIESLPTREESPRPNELTRLAAQLIFALVWLVLNISLLYIILSYVHLSFPLRISILLATTFFLCRIWLQENKQFFHHTAITWREMSKDLHSLISRRKD